MSNGNVYAWMSGSPTAKYGGSFLSGRSSPVAEASALTSAATPPAGNASRAWHPDSALFWVAGLIIVATGLGGASTTVRLGKGKAGIQVGKT
jgi:hypothetical protein